MKNRVFVFLLYGCLPLLGCLSCGEGEKYFYDNRLYSADKVLALEEQKNEAMLAQITPSAAPVGGSLVVIIPTDELLLQTFGPAKPPGRSDTTPRPSAVWLQTTRNQLIAAIEALRKRVLFETVEWRQSAHPEQETFEADFALLRPARRDADWLLRAQTQKAQGGVPVAGGPSSASWIQWTTIWLDNIERAARKLKSS